MRETVSRRSFLKRSSTVAALLTMRGSAKGVRGEVSPAGIPNSPLGPIQGPVAGPTIGVIHGQMGPITELADGRFLALYPEGRIDVQWDRLDIPQRMWGRYSADGLVLLC